MFVTLVEYVSLHLSN